MSVDLRAEYPESSAAGAIGASCAARAGLARGAGGAGGTAATVGDGVRTAAARSPAAAPATGFATGAAGGGRCERRRCRRSARRRTAWRTRGVAPAVPASHGCAAARRSEPAWRGRVRLVGGAVASAWLPSAAAPAAWRPPAAAARSLRRLRLRLVCIFRQQRARAGEELAAVDLLLLHFLQPGVDDRLGRLAPMRDRFRQQRDDDIAALAPRCRRPRRPADPTSRPPCRPRTDPNYCRSRFSVRAAAGHRPACSSPARMSSCSSEKSENSVCVLSRSFSRSGGTRCQGSTQPSTTCCGDRQRQLRARHRHRMRAEHAHRLAGKTRLHVQFQILDVLDRPDRRDWHA